MASRCLSCDRSDRKPAPGSQFCEECRVRLIKSGMVELALPGELDQAGQFTPYIELKRRERERGVGQ